MSKSVAAKSTTALSGIATLALAVLPALAIVTGAHAETVSVKVADLNLNTATGQKVLEQRIDVAARKYCAGSITTGTHVASSGNACRAAVKAELMAKVAKPSQQAAN